MDIKEYLQSVRRIEEYMYSRINAGSKVISDFNLSKKHYSYLKPYVRIVLKNASSQGKVDIILLYMLVQFTMREYQGTDFYNAFTTSMGCTFDVDNACIRNSIKKTIRYFHLLEFGCFDARNEYVECLKSHSLTYYAKQNKLFDSSLKVYEWLGANIQEKGIVEQELFYIKSKIANTYSSDNDDDAEIVFGEDINGKSAPRLYLPSSTCKFFALSDMKSIMRIYYPILQLIDDWYYPDDEPNIISENRVEWLRASFQSWKDQQTKKEKGERAQRLNQSPYRNNAPSFKVHVNANSDSFQIIIPEFTNASDNDSDRWYCQIICDEKSIYYKELTIASVLQFDNVNYWKTNKLILDLDWKYLFSNIRIAITKSDDNDAEEVIKEWDIKKNVYRLFDANGFQINKIRANKDNVIFVPVDCSLETKNAQNVRNSKTIYFDKYVFSATEETGLIINTSVFLSVIGQYYSEPYFPDEIKTFTIQKDGTRITASTSHPIISISCNKGEEDAINVKINGNHRRWLSKQEYKTIPDMADSNRTIVTFSIERFFAMNDSEYQDEQDSCSDGIYTVEYGLSGKTMKIISYIILQSFSFKFAKPRFYDTTGELKMSKDYSLVPINREEFTITKLEESQNSYWQKYNIEILPNCEDICFELKEFNVTLSIPVKKAVFWFGNDDNRIYFFRQQTSIPFTMIENSMHVIVSGSREMILTCNGIEVQGHQYDKIDGKFSFDLADIKNNIHTRIPKELSLSYIDSKERKTSIRIHSIRPWYFPDCLICENNRLFYRLESMPDNTALYVDFYENEQSNIAIKSVKLSISEKQELLEIEKNRTYWFQRRISIPNAIPFLPDENYFIDEKRQHWVCYDLDNLAGTRMDIFDNNYTYYYRYTIQVVRKERCRYLGYLFENDIRRYPIALFDLSERKNGISGKMAYYSVKEKCLYRLILNDNRLVPIKREPNDHYYLFDRTTFKKGDK